MNVINISSLVHRLSDVQLERLSADNPQKRFETTSEGKLIIMSPTGSESGRKNCRLLFQIEFWNVGTKLGITFDSSTGFRLKNGAVKSPDVSWIKRDRYLAIPEAQRLKYASIDPDFVVELMSKSDDLVRLQQKMAEYILCGVKLGWLICPEKSSVEIYRQGKDVEQLDNPSTLSGEDVLPGLVVELAEIL